MPRGGKGKPVRCVETGQVFPTAKEAALYLGLTPSSVTSALLGYYKTAGGYSWEYANEKDRERMIPRPSTPKDTPVYKPRSRPRKSIYEVQEEARRRTEETGRLVQYGDIQKEETLQLIKEGKLCHTKKRK